jgi:hypothetical protein
LPKFLPSLAPAEWERRDLLEGMPNLSRNTRRYSLLLSRVDAYSSTEQVDLANTARS